MTRSSHASAVALPREGAAHGTVGTIAHAVAQFVSGFTTACREAARRRRALRQLSALDDRMLKDIGYTRTDVVYHALHHRPDPDLRDRSAAER